VTSIAFRTDFTNIFLCPFAVPRITVYNLTVREDVGMITVPFNRTGGDLSTNSRIFAQTRSVNGMTNR